MRLAMLPLQRVLLALVFRMVVGGLSNIGGMFLDVTVNLSVDVLLYDTLPSLLLVSLHRLLVHLAQSLQSQLYVCNQAVTSAS
jgi:hypothetical protein